MARKSGNQGIAQDRLADNQPEDDKLKAESVSTRKSRRNKKTAEAQEEQPNLGAEHLGTAELEAIVFGRAFKKVSSAPAEVADATGTAQGKEKRKAKGQTDAAGESDEDAKDETHAPAWVDEDDKNLQVDLTARLRSKKLRRSDQERVVGGEEYERRLREQFVKIHGNSTWATTKTEEADLSDDSDAEELIPTSATVTTGQLGVGALRPHDLKLERLKDIHIKPADGEGSAPVVRAMQFHPSSNLMLTAGLDKRLRLFQVDGDENPCVSSHFFRGFPIREASFTPGGDHVLLTGGGHSDANKLWNFDVRTGTASEVRPTTSQISDRYYGLTVGGRGGQDFSQSSKLFAMLGDAGSATVVDIATKHPVRTFRMAAKGTAAVFSTSRDTLITADAESNLYEWDLGSGRCMQRIKEPWATGITGLAMSREGPFSPRPILSVATKTGNVDLYDAGAQQLSKEPYKSIPNLTVSCNVAKFNPSGEMLAIGSNEKKDSFKVIHTATCSVFENWPTMKTPLKKVTVADFSHDSQFMTIGNERGQVLLYRLAHFAAKSR